MTMISRIIIIASLQLNGASFAQTNSGSSLSSGVHWLGWRAADLTARRKGDPAKVKLARAARAQTTMPLAWIADRLAMGSRGYLTWLLQRRKEPNI